MSKKSKIFSRLVLYPMSRLYGAVVYARNKFFDWGVLSQCTFDVPVVVVGNLSVGGTGKTPHVEYIVELLRYKYNIGVVSRGYKRQTKGFVMATASSTPNQIGDEPYQIFRKFGRDVSVAVCENRVEGINELLQINPDINLIVLDDAFQHRYVKPTVSVVITEFSRPVFNDDLLPYGRLRESRGALSRADIVVVSKCPEVPKGVDLMLYERNLDLFPYQRVFFSKFEYGSLVPVFPSMAPAIPPSLHFLSDRDMVLIVAGIGNPKPFVKHIRRYKARVWINIFPDHHNFNKRDFAVIVKRFETMRGNTKFIVTTEKDAVRMVANPDFPNELKPFIYYLPVKVNILKNEADAFVDFLERKINALP